MNKLFGLLLLALAFIPGGAEAATCFWVGGTGSINDTTKWSSSSGGAGSTCAAAGGWPNSTADNGTFDANSGGGTITRNVAWTIATLNVAAFTGTFGNSGDTATVQLDTFTNNGSGTRTVNLGGSTWTCGRPSTTNCVWQVTGATNLTQNPDTSSLILENGGAAGTALCWLGSAFTYNNVTFNPSTTSLANRAGWWCNTTNITFANLTIGSPNNIQFTAGRNWTVTGTLSFSGGTPSNTSLLFMQTDSLTSAFTFTLSGGAATCTWCVIFNMTAATNIITANNSLSIGRNTNITFNPPSGGGGGGRIIGG